MVFPSWLSPDGDDDEETEIGFEWADEMSVAGRLAGDVPGSLVGG